MAARPAMAQAVIRMNTQMDLRDLLPKIGVPTLILHRAGDRWIEVGHARYMAERIPGAPYWYGCSALPPLLACRLRKGGVMSGRLASEVAMAGLVVWLGAGAALADGTYHTSQYAFGALDGTSIRSGFVEHIHADGPDV